MQRVLTASAWADQLSLASTTIPKKVAVGDKGICSFPMRSLMLASLLLTLLFVNKTSCDLDAEILKQFADKNLFLPFYWAASACLLSLLLWRSRSSRGQYIASSSAYMDSSTPLQGFGIAFIMMMNRRGLRTLPCGVPFSKTSGSERADPTLTWILLSWRKLWIHSSGLPLTPILESCSMIPSLQTMSKAFSKSRKTLRVICFLVEDAAISCVSLTMWSIQPLPFLKPAWYWFNMFLLSRNHLSLVAVCFALILLYIYIYIYIEREREREIERERDHGFSPDCIYIYI